jgi:hypothetical protein
VPIKQLSVFLENDTGHAGRVTAVLEKAGASIRGFSLADTGQFGIARIVVDKPEVARLALEEDGFIAQTSEVLCVELVDRPGELARVLSLFASAGVNIDYAYSLVSTYVVLKVANNETAAAQLAAQPLRLVEQAEIAALRVAGGAAGASDVATAAGGAAAGAAAGVGAGGATTTGVAGATANSDVGKAGASDAATADGGTAVGSGVAAAAGGAR